MMNADLAGSQAVILLVVGGIIALIIIGAIIKNAKKGIGWIIGFIILAIAGYLLISSEIIK